MEAFFATVLLVTAFAGIRWYFRGARLRRVSRAERTVALAWLITRRIVCFAAALLCFVAAVIVLYSMYLGLVTAMSIFGLVLSVAFGYIFVHLGLYGMGHKRLEWNEDKAVHEARKKRYGWRW